MYDSYTQCMNFGRQNYGDSKRPVGSTCWEEGGMNRKNTKDF